MTRLRRIVPYYSPVWNILPNRRFAAVDDAGRDVFRIIKSRVYSAATYVFRTIIIGDRYAPEKTISQ